MRDLKSYIKGSNYAVDILNQIQGYIHANVKWEDDTICPAAGGESRRRDSFHQGILCIRIQPGDLHNLFIDPAGGFLAVAIYQVDIH